jgi:serine/tyrosine/threonine adenylyltransferase
MKLNAPILELGLEFYDEVEPAKFPQQILRFRNQAWAEQVGLGTLTAEEWRKHFALYEALPQNLEKPLALRYHGHQFQHYNPDLGDGRGFLFAQIRDRQSRLLDLGTKGSGTTPYSRRGDGRLTLKGAVREILATEMLESLGVNTSKTFSVYETGEDLVRGDEPSPTRSAVLTRLSHSHVRYGSFQRLAYLQKPQQIAELLEYSIRHFYPELVALPEKEKPAAFLKAVAIRAADLCAGWMIAGFVHGVLNTDNMNVTGESFDYGPYRFLPHYDPEFTAAYFDHSGLYAFGRQPEAVLWNLEQLGASFLPLLDQLQAPQEPLIEALNVFAPRFNDAIVAACLDRLGLESQGEEADSALFMAVFDFLQGSRATFPQFFHDWYGGEASANRALNSPEKHLYNGDTFEKMRACFKIHPVREGVGERLKLAYFAHAKPCTLLIDEIEEIWAGIAVSDDWSQFDSKVLAIREMGKLYGRRSF